MDIKTNNGPQNIKHKTKIEQHELHYKTEVIKVCFCPQKRMSPPVPQTVVKGKKSI